MAEEIEHELARSTRARRRAFCGPCASTTQTAIALDDLQRGRGRRAADLDLRRSGGQGDRANGAFPPPACSAPTASSSPISSTKATRPRCCRCRRRASPGLSAYALRGVQRAPRRSVADRRRVRPRRPPACRARRRGAERAPIFSRLEIELLDADAMTARVFVPLVGANGEGAQLFEAIAGDFAPEAHPARLAAANLRAVRFRPLRHRPDRARGGDPLRRRAPRQAVAQPQQRPRQSLEFAHFRSADRPPVRRERAFGRARPDAGGDLPGRFGRDPGVVFATGEIVLPSAPGAPAVAIGPVGGLRGKLSLVGDYIVQHRQALEGSKMIVVLPATAIDGRPLETAEAATLERLREEARGGGRASSNSSSPTRSTRVEAALGPFAMREIVTPARAARTRRRAGRCSSRCRRRLDRADCARRSRSPSSRSPRRRRAASPTTPRRNARATMRRPTSCNCSAPASTTSASRSSSAAKRSSCGSARATALPFASRLRPPRLFIASVSRAADPVILDAEHFRSLVGAPRSGFRDIDLTAAIPIEPVEDEVRLFVVATRDPSIEITGLQDALRKDAARPRRRGGADHDDQLPRRSRSAPKSNTSSR